MAVNISLNAVFDGKGLEELSKLLDRRIHELGENPYPACVATLTDAISSIRAITAKAKIPKSFNNIAQSHFPVFETLASRGNRQGWHAGYGKNRKRCIYNGKQVVIESGVKGFVNLVDGGWPQDPTRLGVYRILYRQVTRRVCDPKLYYLVARSVTDVRKWCVEKVARLVRSHQGMARFALSYAQIRMNCPKNPERVSPSASGIASKAVRVSTKLGKEMFQMEVADDLEYAVLAVKGGAPAIDLALKKAANKVASRLAHKYKAFLEMTGGSISNPFPELVRRR